MTLEEEIQGKVPEKIRELLPRRDSVAQLVSELPKLIPAAEAAVLSDGQRVWELCGLYFLSQLRFHEALAVFYALYDQMLSHQESSSSHVHKGMPLIWISECHAQLGHPVLAKRYLMLSCCEDAIRDKGEIPPETTGTYFRMVWNYGFSHEEVSRYAATVWDVYNGNPKEAMFPEWILQEIDTQWMTEYPSPQEAALFIVNRKYIRWLLDQLGSTSGKALERIAHYLLSSMPGCRAYMRKRSESTDYDVVCVFEGLGLDFRSELGRYVVCECKDWSDPAGFTAFAKFCRVLDSIKCRFGILFSKEGITGSGKTTAAEREQLKVFQDRGIVVVVVSEADLVRVASGGNFITIIRAKYEAVRLDLQKSVEMD